MKVLLPLHPRIRLLSKEAISLFTVMQLAIHFQTSLGQKMATTQCCIMERRTTLLTYRDRLLDSTHVQLGIHWANRKMPQLQLLYIVRFGLVFFFSIHFTSCFILTTCNSGRWPVNRGLQIRTQ